MKSLDEIKDIQDLLKDIDEMTFSKLKYSVFVETDLDKFGQLINEGIIEKTKSWCKENCWAKWEGHGFIFMFELESDAVAFKLRWT